MIISTIPKKAREAPHSEYSTAAELEISHESRSSKLEEKESKYLSAHGGANLK